MEHHFVRVAQNGVVLYKIKVSALCNLIPTLFSLHSPQLRQQKFESIELQSRRNQAIIRPMNIEYLLDCMLTDSDNFSDVRETLIEVKDADLFAFFCNFHFILLLNRSIVYEYRVTFLNFDKAGVLMNGLPNNGVSLVMLFHQHQQT